MKMIRKIELGIGEGETQGQWWTETLDIPRDTPEIMIESACLRAYHEKHPNDTRVIGLLDVYWIPELDDPINPRYYRALRDITASELAMVTAHDFPDPVMIPKGAIVQEGLEGDNGSSIDIIYDHPEYLLVGDLTAYVAAADLEAL